MKIQKVINDCTDCEFAKEYIEVGGNTSYVLICNYEKSDDEKTEKNPFLILQLHRQILNRTGIEIPKNCPLEDYETNKN